jgi:hypothetical protein
MKTVETERRPDNQTVNHRMVILTNFLFFTLPPLYNPFQSPNKDVRNVGTCPGDRVEELFNAVECLFC